jgi:MoaA/NifB/PqqE/SkfB family radical SAM enzyme
MIEWAGITSESLHLGLTYKCTLKCLECARTNAFKDNIPDIVNTMHLDWKQYIPLIEMHNPRVIELCGNWGDPIYYPDLFQLIKFIKRRDKTTHIVLHTNGSYRTKEWWHELGCIMNKCDRILFSIDGTHNSFTKYRVNADIDSIKQGINTLKKIQKNKRPVLEQKTILFDYVKDDLQKIVFEAYHLGFDYIRFDWPHVDNHMWLVPTFTRRHLRKYFNRKNIHFNFPEDKPFIWKDLNNFERKKIGRI